MYGESGNKLSEYRLFRYRNTAGIAVLKRGRDESKHSGNSSAKEREK